MYKGDYDQEAIFLNKELDRKRIENEKCEAILYQADYEVLNSWNKDIRETRVVKFIHDNGEVYHGVYRGIDVDKNAPNELDSIYNTLSTDKSLGEFWCAEKQTIGNSEDTPCEIWLGNRDIDGNIDWNNSVCLNEKALKEWAANYEGKTVEVTFTANIPEEKIGEIKVNHNKEDMCERKILTEKMAIDIFKEKYGEGFGSIIDIGGEKYIYDENFGSTTDDGIKNMGHEIITEALKIGSIISNNKVDKYLIYADYNLNLSEEEKGKLINEIDFYEVNDVGVRKSNEKYNLEQYFKLKTEINIKDTEHYLTSPPPPLVDGVSIRINGLDDVTEREAKKYIDLVVQKVQESVRKNLSSISITKQEDGHIKLDYVLHHEPFERIRRITGYLVGSMDKWNNAKRAEEHERVKHIVGNREDSGDPRVDEAIEKRFKQEQEYDKRFDELQEKEETYERCLEEKDFTHAYELHDSVSTENDALDFMKDVVRKHGTDTQILNDAVDAVTVLKGEYPDFTAKLMQDTLKTDEYKKSFEAGQGKSQDYTK